VAALTSFGHGGRLVFAGMTLVFVASAAIMLAHGFLHPSVVRGRAPVTGPQGSPVVAALLSFPVAMALATGTEAPSTAIGQLDQLDADERRRFARGTLMLTLVIVAALTIAITMLALRLHIGIPSGDSTQIADVARAAAGKGLVYALFQAASALLLLAAASSSLQAGPGLLKALSRHPRSAGVGILPRPLAVTNAHHTPILVGRRVRRRLRARPPGRWRPRAGARPGVGGRRLRQLPGRPQRDGAVLSPGAAPGTRTDEHRGRDRRGIHARGQSRPWLPMLSLAAMSIIAATLYTACVRQGRRSGVEEVELLAEAEP
jgi:hypothetical protein